MGGQDRWWLRRGAPKGGVLLSIFRITDKGRLAPKLRKLLNSQEAATNAKMNGQVGS